MLFSGKNLRVVGAALAVVLLWPAVVVADVYQVTRSGMDGSDSGGYTLATAIEAANASGQPATIEIMVFSVLVTETLVVDTPVQIQPGPDLDHAAIHARLDGPLFDLRAGAEGSVFSHVSVYGDVPVTTPTSAFSVCADGVTFSGVYVSRFQQAFHLDCAAPLSLAIADSYLLRNGRQLSGALLPGSTIQVHGSIIEAPEIAVDLQAPECGGSVVIEDSAFREFSAGLVRDWNVELVRLRGCLDAEFRSVTVTDMGAFLQALPHEASTGPTVLVTNSLIQGAPTLSLPIIDFEGQQLTLRHTSLTAGGVDADHPCVRHRDGALLLDHTVIAGNGCQDDVLVEDGTLEASYSLLGQIEAPPATMTLDSVSQQLLGSDPLLASPPAHREPMPGSPLINAGDPLRQPGEGTTPWQDVRGSARLNGSAIDIGAIEFNRRPYIRMDDFYKTLRTRVKQAGPDDTIAIPLEPYLADPDGHQIIELVLLQVDIPWPGYGEQPYPLPVSSLSMDENTWTLIGKEADFRGFVAAFELTDELGLRNVQGLEFDKAWPSSGSGGASVLWLLLGGLLIWRRPGHAKRAGVFGVAVVVVLATPGVAASTLYRVTLAEGPDQPDQGEYTFAGAIAAANLSPAPAEISLEIPIWLEEGVEITSPVAITTTSPGFSLNVKTALASGAALTFGPGASGSSLRGAAFVQQPAVQGVPHEQAVGIRICAEDITFQETAIVGYHTGLLMSCDTPVGVSFSGLMQANRYNVAGDLVSGSRVALQNVYLLPDTGSIALSARECGVDFILRDAYLRNDEAVLDYDDVLIDLEGCVTAHLDNVVLQGRGPLLAARQRTVDGEAPQGAELDITHSSLHHAQVYRDAPLIHFDGAALRIRHTTIGLNPVASDVPCIVLADGDALIDHSIIARNGCATDVLVSGGQLEVTRSLLGSLDDVGHRVTMDAISVGLLGQDPLFDPNWIIPEPALGSPVIDVGDPARVPGDDGLRATDVRGSARLTGSAIDPGAVEFNRRPVFQEEVFFRDLRAQASATAKGDDIVMRPMDYVVDPDGHQVTLIHASAVGLYYENATDTLFGTEADYRRGQLELFVEDELGLRHLSHIDLGKAWSQSGSRGGVVAPLTLFTLGGLLWRRRSPRSCG